MTCSDWVSFMAPFSFVRVELRNVVWVSRKRSQSPVAASEPCWHAHGLLFQFSSVGSGLPEMTVAPYASASIAVLSLELSSTTMISRGGEVCFCRDSSR